VTDDAKNDVHSSQARRLFLPSEPAKLSVGGRLNVATVIPIFSF